MRRNWGKGDEWSTLKEVMMQKNQIAWLHQSGACPFRHGSEFWYAFTRFTTINMHKTFAPVIVQRVPQLFKHKEAPRIHTLKAFTNSILQKIVSSFWLSPQVSVPHCRNQKYSKPGENPSRFVYRRYETVVESRTDAAAMTMNSWNTHKKKKFNLENVMQATT
jgi:hypothetical protein